MKPIPQPGEILEFILRNFTHVDGENNSALDKKLQRMADLQGFLSEEIRELSLKKLSSLLKSCPDSTGILETLVNYKDHYFFAVRELECGSRGAIEVRSVFDSYAVSLFVELLTPLSQKLGFKVEDVIGHPAEGVSVVWNARLQGKTIRALSADLQKKIPIEARSWETEIGRWSRKSGMSVSKILAIQSKYDFDLGFALALANAYRNYCCLEMVDTSRHTSRYEKSVETVLEEIKLQNSISHEQFREARCKNLLELSELTAPSREKVAGDVARAEACIELLKEELCDSFSLANLSLMEGMHLAQLGDRKAALKCFDEAGAAFSYHSAAGFECAMTYLFATSAAINEKQIRNRWTARCETIGLEVMPQETDTSFKSLFPNSYPEALGCLPIKTSKVGFPAAAKWKGRTPDLSNPGRRLRDWGDGPVSQLHIYTFLLDRENIQALLKKGADPGDLDKRERSPLFFAIKRGDKDVFYELIDATKKATIDTKAKNGETCLHEAIKERHSGFVESLLSKGADFEIEGPQGGSPLFAAANNFRSPQRLLEDFLDPHQRAQKVSIWGDRHWQTPSPFRHRHAEAWESFINKNPRIVPQMDEYFQKQQSELVNCKEIVLSLLDAGADITTKVSCDGMTPFLFAAEIGDPWLFRTLIEYGANVRDKLDDGTTALTQLYTHNHNELAKWFLLEVSAEDRLWFREATRVVSTGAKLELGLKRLTEEQ